MKNRVLVGNISAETDESVIRDAFHATRGVILSVSIPLDPKTQKNRGYAFVDMTTDLQAERAVLDLNGLSVSGRALSCTVVDAPVAARKWYQLKAK